VNFNYDPENSLSSSLSQLTDQLQSVPQSLGALEENLASSGTSLDKVSSDANLLAKSLGDVQAQLGELVAVVEQYEQQLTAFQATVRSLRENIVTIVWGIALFLTFILFWLGVTMVLVLLKGLDWMGIRFRWRETAPVKEFQIG
jgi:chromosome segregation ATPase